MKKIIIISDSHGNDKKLLDILDNNKYDYSICAGDYETNLELIKKSFNFHVAGNHDFDGNHKEYFFEIEGIKFYLQHGHLMGNYSELDNNEFMMKYFEKLDVDVIIHGHTHISKVEKLTNNKWIINPGSISFPRGNSRASYILGTVEKGSCNFEIMEAK